ncbi:MULTISPECIES: TonB-dependent receptor [unclassified Imperialibacter]|uniref:SusC/RagA family TonB-linked outer membrane protein n=2 Tax=Imperialibacter TaxID=1649461 RepID=UPI00125713F9|nr:MULTISPECIES: TonB-dependent receptor [unclassified Imperialibacter]CAD5277524.1 TonB-linked outer membrane protein, SusC/RagA family [Imperialibacter sp. 89]CAD5299514.1 TonB-linked outer membrane protein, SusC/RagA family [Imperialibacter sp. 75]VVT27513.1 TonB-linked outer membrane protein, SusC/RagA family [Imperialibacter sp. EC-SDR9]
MKKGLLKYIFPLICLALLAVAPDASAQNRQVTGKITDSETGEGFPGVSVLEVGTSNGTVTDLNGNYSLSVGSGARLSFSFIGYVTQEVEVGSRSVIDVPLALDVKQLQELVITGYTVDNRRETSGSISTVKPKDIAVIPTGNVEQSLAGRIAGVNVITNGQPGSTSQIRVRGFGAFGGNAPLYVVDGVPVGDTNFLSPDDIESTTVLKDAAAASIYGARAANGVIVYTTKKGSKTAKKISIDYNSMFGMTFPGKGIEMMNPADFAEWTWNAERNQARIESREPVFSHPQFGTGSSPVLPDFLSVGGESGRIGTYTAAEAAMYNVDPAAGSVYQITRAATGAGTDWYDAITRVAPLQRQTLGLHGGTDRSRFYFSLSAQDQAGIVTYNQFKRYSFRANSEFDLLPNLRFGENMQFTYRSVLAQQGNEGGQGVADDENDILSAFRMPTIIPVYDEFGGYAGTASKGFNNPRNPVATRDGQKNNRGFNGSGFGNVYLEYDPIPGLTLRTNVGGQYGAGYSWGYGRRQYENSENNSAFSYSESANWGFQWNFTNTANYKKTFGVHNIDLLVGQEALNTGRSRGMSADGLNPFSQDPDFVTISTLGSRNPPNSYYDKGVNFSSYFGRANYILNDKYIFSAVIRRDGSSRFGAENRYGVFPAFSAAWRLSSESFMSSLTFIDDLKIRGGYGTMGNSNNVNPNNQYSLYATTIANSSYDIAGSNGNAAGFYRSRIGNAAAKWETSVTQNIGIDGTLFDGKLDVIVDFWRKDTKDLLFNLPVPLPLGVYAAAPSVNIGEMRNQGIDLQLINRGNLTSDLTYEVNVTGSLLKNEIVKLDGDLLFFTDGTTTYRGIAPIRNPVGYTLSSFWGYEVESLWQSAAEVTSANSLDGDGSTEFQAGAAPGHFRYRDLDGDGKITEDDRKFLGSPVAPFTGGLTFSLGYKNFDLAAYFYTSIGNEIWNQSRWFTDFYPSFAGAAIAERVKDSWSPTNTGSNQPVFDKSSNFSTNTQANSYYVENGSYLRLQNITLGYKMPADLLSRLKMTQLRVFVSANNLMTITGYEGLDPSVGGNADINFGVDVGNYPITKGFTGGIQLGF